MTKVFSTSDIDLQSVLITRVGDFMVVTDGVATSDTAVLFFQTRVFNIRAEVQEPNVMKTISWSAASKEHDEVVKWLMKNSPERFAGLNKEICILCGSKMREKHGSFGKFYGCTAYPKCPCTVSPRGELGKKTLAILDERKKIAKEAAVHKTETGERFADLELE